MFEKFKGPAHVMFTKVRALTPRLRTYIVASIVAGLFCLLALWPLAVHLRHTTHKIPDAATPHSTHGVKSSLINLTLPAGSTGTADNDGSGELWTTGLDENATEDLLRSQLPINAPLDGLSYCGEEISSIGGKEAQWSWASPQRKVVVRTFYSRGSGIVIAIHKLGVTDPPYGAKDYFQC